MLPNFFVEDAVRREDGTSPAVDVSALQGEAILLTLGITRIVEQESLDVVVHGSTDGTTWSPKPIASFPQKFYCGAYSLLLDLSQVPDIKQIRLQWSMNRWGRGDSKPLFAFYVFAEAVQVAAAAT